MRCCWVVLSLLVFGSHARAEDEYVLPYGLAGRAVFDDGQPAVGAVIRVDSSEGERSGRAVVDAKGHYEIKGTWPGPHRVYATADREGRTYAVEIPVEVRSKGLTRLDLTLTPGRAPLTARVLLPDGKPVPRFEARLLRPSGYANLGTQSSGSLTIARAWVGALLEIWGARDANDRGLPLSPVRIGPLTSAKAKLEVRMKTGPVVAGRVHVPEGETLPPEGIQVNLRLFRYWWIRMDDDRLIDAGVDRGGAALPRRLPFDGLSTTVRPDAEGRFRIALFRPAARHQISVEAPDTYVRPGRWQVEAGDEPIVVHLRRPTQARVTVLGPGGKPVPGAWVRALELKGNGYGSGLRAQTGEDGVAVLGAQSKSDLGGYYKLDPSATYKLVVNANYAPGIIRDPRSRWNKNPLIDSRTPPYLAEKAIEPWSPKRTVVRLERGFTLEGRVLDSNDRPVEGRHVGLCSSVGFGCYDSKADGRFTFHGVPAGEAFLGLDDGGPMGGIVDRLREIMWDASYGDRREHSPEDPPPIQSWTKLDVKGDATTVVLRVPATVQVRVVPPQPVPVPEDERARAPGERFDQSRVTILRKTKDGWRYHIGVWRRSGRWFGEPQASTEGSLLVPGLIPGDRYAAWMTPVGGKYVYTEFGPDVGTLTLVRSEGGTLRGRITGRPHDAGRIRITLRSDRGCYLSTRTPDAQGRFVVHGLPRHTWTVSAWCRGADDVIWEAQAEAKVGTSVELKLEPASDEDDD